MDRFVARVSERAQSITPLRVLLTLLMLPFWVLGAVIAVLWLAVSWGCSAFMTGFEDAQTRIRPEREPDGDT